MSTTHACCLLGVSPEFIFRRVQDGRLIPHSKDGGTWLPGKRLFFEPADIEALKESPPPEDHQTWLSVEDAAAFLGMNRLSVFRLGRDDKLVSRKILNKAQNGRRSFEFEQNSLIAYRDRMNRRPPISEESEWMPIAEAMKTLKMTRHGVKRRIKMGLLDGTHFGPREALALYVRRSQVCDQVLRPPDYERRTESFVLPASEAELAWFGGFFNGEGCIIIYRRHKRRYVAWSMRINLVNSDIWAVNHAEEVIGGKTYFRKRQKPHCRDQRVWQAGGDEALAILKAIRPYLHRKGLQADLAIEFQERIRSKHHGRWAPLPPGEQEWREAQKEKISRLNRPNVPR